jgi:hypothetical protein
MRNQDCKFIFSQLCDDAFLCKADSIIKCMCGCDFPAPIPKCSELKNVFEAYKTAFDKSTKAIIYISEEKAIARKVLEKMLMRLPAYSHSAISSEP